MADCPNCGFDVPEGVRICPNCGFDTGEGQAERVRELREEGVIHPGRLGAEDSNEFAGGEPDDRAPEHDPTPAEEARIDPEQTDAGL